MGKGGYKVSRWIQSIQVVSNYPAVGDKRMGRAGRRRTQNRRKGGGAAVSAIDVPFTHA
jgi:hypothetical protein